ncbi:hypothetical protein F5Y17DRAFT_416859 [Xylariaceae sp. FL0594]|nr:hypothetical protein F5Y17DRAFT_416859 [Xylariaceae sp. FL0594]
MLAAARRWLVKPNSYMIRNPDTGCWGLSSRKPRLSDDQWQKRATITIAHAARCNCHDVRLRHICEHVDRLIKAGFVTRRFRNDLIIVLKTRRPLERTLLPEVSFPKYKKQRIKEALVEEEKEKEEKVRRVVDVYENQVLIENWKNLEAFRKRKIWLDW